MDDLIVGYFFIGNGDPAAFDTAWGLDDDGVVLFELFAVGVKVVNLAYFLEPYADYFCKGNAFYSEQQENQRFLSILYSLLYIISYLQITTLYC